MSSATVADVMSRFDSKVDVLVRSSFVNEMIYSKPSVDVLEGGKAAWWRLNVPSVESAKAFIIDYRLIIQDNDGISLRLLGAAYEAEFGQDWPTREYQRLRTSVNALLDEPAFHDSEITNRVLQDTFLYGWFAHEDPSKALQIEEWRKTEPRFAFMHLRFYGVLIEVTLMAMRIRALNRRVRAEMKMPEESVMLPDGAEIHTYA
jgi:hypothetical protein